MNRGWINLRKNIITVRKGSNLQTKSKKERIIPFDVILETTFLRYTEVSAERMIILKLPESL
ncbi:MAG: hypothetical protein R3250_02615 [Melioribacteraceae bacterium]|nr:hypothetical protein [Melioribacteraceae bacterium]